MRKVYRSPLISLYSPRFHAIDQDLLFYILEVLTLAPNEAPKRLYQPLYQADATSKDRFLDTGEIEVHQNTNLAQCMSKCASDLKCKSFSVYDGNCHLHDKKRAEVEKEQYVHKKGSTYYEEL